MVARHLETGLNGEKIAKEYLIARGYKILETNFRSKYGEIDIICELDKEIIFVEVRVRNKKSQVNPIETINKNKFKKLYKTASIYLSQNKFWQRPCRFDFIGILVEKNKWRIKHVQNVWQGETFYCSNSSWQPW
ncbi:YraN family protein [Desulfonauticus submarinus]|uniref:YraN family protein n=1 Tax=Desulfonauticus submarinus TaxID=206665 RepID=UPI000B88D091|nr:YraN family protein [Desulfonauticus submarinus]